MALRPRGDNSNDSTPKTADDITSSLFEAFGLEGEPTRPDTAEESLNQIRAVSGEDGVLAAELMLAGSILYAKMQADPGNKDLTREFYAIVQLISELDKKALTTVIATGLISTGELRIMLGKNK